jgi:hypothetical protein
MILSRFHISDHKFYRLDIFDPNQSNMSTSQYIFLKNMLSNLLPFNYFKSISASIHQILYFQKSLQFSQG